MPAVYARHNAGPAGGQAARIPLRPAGSRGHTPSWSASSNDGLGVKPMSLPSREDDVSPLASTPTALVDRPLSEQQGPSWALLARRIRPYSIRKLIVFMCLIFVIFGGAWMIRKDSANRLSPDTATIDMYLPPIAQLPASPEQQPKVDPVDWLRHNTILNIDQVPASYRESLRATRPRAAFIALVRNAEVDDMVHSISQLEARFNGRETHRYDWVFFNDEEFSEEFKVAVTNVASSRCFFEMIPEKHWRVPPWIDETRFDVGREFMGSIGVGKAWLQSYHHMCRWNAGLFAMEKRLADYDYFWRVEPGVEFSCNINYDVFRFMRDTDMAYGFNMAILDDARSFPSLWERTKVFIKHHKEMLAADADLNWLVQDIKETKGTGLSSFAYDEEGNVVDGIEYNNCQFYSNFEIGSLDFFRSKEHRAYFDHLDKAGGFYYERVGDAPVHTLSVSMFLPKSRIWYFRDIGYAHSLCAQCPPHKNKLTVGPETESVIKARLMVTNSSLSESHLHWEILSRDVIRQWGIPGLSCGCTVSAIDVNNAKLVPYESKQRKPAHPCIRLYLEGKWLEKKPDFSIDDEIAAGRDGSGGYLHDGLEDNPSHTT
ncbi:glycolipid 2-alpha-mannosyltransferase-domain-containing protein [Biscogniauxia marginata]|nr:glycolipid 2-alpha-mannosyltransferase-domain-containing protein [Biscogniauxia marginata]